MIEEEITVVYARQSTKEQQSVDWQSDWAKGLANERGWNFAGGYLEVGGHSDDLSLDGRPQLRRLIKDAQNGGVRRIVVWDRTRLARGEDLILLLEAFAKFGVKVYIGDLASEYGDNTELAVDFLRVMDKHFLKTLRKNTRKGMAVKKAEGVHVGRPPLGFRVTDDGKVVVEPWAEEIKLACAEQGIKTVYESQRFVTPRGKHAGKPLSLTGIKRVLRNVQADNVADAVASSSAASRERFQKVKSKRDQDAHGFRQWLRDLMGPQSDRASL